MPRDVDQKKTRKALRKLRKAKERAEADGIELTDWEQDFVDGVDERLTKYGSAFVDPNLGASDEALSNAQTEILRQLDKKSRGKTAGGFKTRKPLRAKKGKFDTSPRSRQLNDDLEETPKDSGESDFERSVPYTENLPRLRVVTDDDAKADTAPAPKPNPRTVFRVIDGGKAKG